MKISKEAKIGLFAIICLAVLVWGLNFLKGKNVFSSTNIYYAVFSRVDGLKPTNDVVLSGFKVGSVKGIKFQEGHTGKLIVTLLIEKKYQIPLGSKIKLISSDIMGGKALRLDLCQNDAFHQNGDTLSASIETGLLDQVIFEMVPIKEKAENLMESLENALKTINEVFDEKNRKNINQSFESLKNSLAHVDNLTKELEGIMNQENGKLTQIVDNVHSVTEIFKDHGEDFEHIIKNFSNITDTLAKANIARTLAQTDSVMHALNLIVSKINNGEGSVGMLLQNDTLYYNLESASENLELLLQDIKDNPKRYVNISLFDFSRTRYEREKRR